VPKNLISKNSSQKEWKVLFKRFSPHIFHLALYLPKGSISISLAGNSAWSEPGILACGSCSWCREQRICFIYVKGSALSLSSESLAILLFSRFLWDNTTI
jgi:hypothetical protein